MNFSILSPLSPPPPAVVYHFFGVWGVGWGWVKSLCVVGFEPCSGKRVRDKPSRHRLSGRGFQPTLGRLSVTCLYTQPLSLAAQMGFTIANKKLKLGVSAYMPACFTDFLAALLPG